MMSPKNKENTIKHFNLKNLSPSPVKKQLLKLNIKRIGP